MPSSVPEFSRNPLLFKISAMQLDLDNITIPTTVFGLRCLLPEWVFCHLASTPFKNKDLPGYVLVAEMGLQIVARLDPGMKQRLCNIITQNGPAVAPSEKDTVFSISRVQVSCSLLLNALEEAQVEHVAVFGYGMKARESIHDLLGRLPTSSDTGARRRVDIGRNYTTDIIPLFKLDHWAAGNNGQVS